MSDGRPSGRPFFMLGRAGLRAALLLWSGRVGSGYNARGGHDEKEHRSFINLGRPDGRPFLLGRKLGWGTKPPSLGPCRFHHNIANALG